MSCIHRIPLGFTSWLFRSSSNNLVKAHAGFWRQFYAALNSIFVPASQNTDVILFHYVLLDLYGNTTSVGVRGSYLRIRGAAFQNCNRLLTEMKTSPQFLSSLTKTGVCSKALETLGCIKILFVVSLFCFSQKIN